MELFLILVSLVIFVGVVVAIVRSKKQITEPPVKVPFETLYPKPQAPANPVTPPEIPATIGDMVKEETAKEKARLEEVKTPRKPRKPRPKRAKPVVEAVVCPVLPVVDTKPDPAIVAVYEDKPQPPVKKPRPAKKKVVKPEAWPFPTEAPKEGEAKKTVSAPKSPKAPRTRKK